MEAVIGGRSATPALGALLALALTTAPVVAQKPGGCPAPASAADRPRAREAGIRIGALPPGPLNAITDVEGVRVGHATLCRGDDVRTGITAVLPHGGNLFRQKVRGAIAVGNGFGKLIGVTQVNELGEIETPVLLTGTLAVWRAADGLVDTLLATPGNEEVRSINPVVGETNDGYLSAIRRRPVAPEDVRRALRTATAGPVAEGSVGAGTGTRALGWKGGIGTASRVVETPEGRFTVGVLVQTNYGGRLTVAGVPVWRELAGNGLSAGPPGGGGAGGPSAVSLSGGEASGDGSAAAGDPAHRGSVMIVVATDAPLAHRELQRVALRTFLGISRTGSYMSFGSGDYAIAFSTDREARRVRDARVLSPLFEATVEATEEAAVNSLFRATTVTGRDGHTARALPVQQVLRILRAHDRLVGAGPP